MLYFELIGRNASLFQIPNDLLTIWIGRSADCEVYLPSPTVAKHHVRFAIRSGEWLDGLKLANGIPTKVNGKEVSIPFGIIPGDEIEVGEFILRLRRL